MLKRLVPLVTLAFAIPTAQAGHGSAVTTLAETSTLLAQAAIGTRSNGIKFVSQVVPDNVQAGQSYTVTIQYKNNTRNALPPNHYQLGLIKPKSKRTWGVNRIDPVGNRAISPGDILTFRFKIQAPSRPGIYDFQWQLRSNGQWLGEPTPPTKITVRTTGNVTQAQAEFVFQKVPGLKKLGEYYAILERGKAYPVTIMFKNTGSLPWRSTVFSLRAQNPAHNLTWTIDSVDLNADEIIKPGEFKAFKFNILTPAEPGIYNFQWQMYQDGVKWFGEPSENVAITVR